MAPKGLNDCERLSRRVAVLSAPNAKTYELVEVSSTDRPAKSTKIASRYM